MKVEEGWIIMPIAVVGGRTRIRSQAIDLSDIFSVERILASRGFQIQSEGTAIDTVLAKDMWTNEEFKHMFTVFDDATLRNELLYAVKDSTFVPSRQEVSSLLASPDFQRDRYKFSNTFEWYVGELLVQKFQAFSSSFGVKVQNIVRNTDNGTAGDFDVLSILGDMNLLYIECKTGRCTQNSIQNTIERGRALHSLAAVIFMGTGTKETALKQQLKKLIPPEHGYCGGLPLQRLNIKNIPDSQVYRWYECFFIPANEESGTVELKLRAVLRLLAAYHSRIHRGSFLDASEYMAMGYDCSDVTL